MCDCVRCGYPIQGGEAWHLDHRDDKVGHLGPSHARCNALAGARLGNKRMREKKALEGVLGSQGSVRVLSRDW